MKLPGPKVVLLIILLFGFITRLPQLASPYLLLDGDECLVGLMAKHIYQGKELPLFFWGQQYGFTLVECLFMLPFYAVLGINAIAVKLAMLSLWTLGVVFLYKTLQLMNKGNEWVPFLLILVFMAHPAWAIWSMKARGGYLTAFTLSNIVLYLSLNDKKPTPISIYFIIGLLLLVIYEAHPFWLAGVMPVVLYKIFNDKKWVALVSILLVFGLLYFGLDVYKKGLVTTYVPPVIIPGKLQAWQYITRIPDFLFASLHGNYYFSFVQKPNFFCAALAYFFEALIFLSPLTGLYYFLFKRKGNMLFIATVIFIPLCLGVTLFSPDIQGRYLLPVTGFMLLPLQLLLNKIRTGKIVVIIATASIAAGIVALITFWNFQFLSFRKDTIVRSVKYLQQHDVKYVFCTDCMVPWQINFYTNESIIARMPYIPERYPPNAEKVNNALALGEKTAIICYSDQLPKLTLQQPQTINDFGIGLNPLKQELEQYFQFPAHHE